MKNFFAAAGIIFVCSLVIGLYYILRHIYHLHNQKKMEVVLRQKAGTDEKEYLRNFFIHQLPKLQKKL